jgi:hypothetical protein
MAKRIFTSGNMTFAATAHAAQATSGGYMSLTGSTGTQITEVLEILITGKAIATTICATYLARESTLGTGAASALTGANSEGPLHFATAPLASPVVDAVAYATNQPIPSSAITDAKLQLGLNLFGGIIRWNASPTQQWTMIGNTAPGGGTILWNNSSAGGVSGLADAHIIYETY